MSAHRRSSHAGLLAIAAGAVLVAPLTGLAAAPDPTPPASAAIDPDVQTTVERVVTADPRPEVSPLPLPYQFKDGLAAGYGTWSYGPGIPVEQRLDLVSEADQAAAAAAVPTAHLADFFTMSDVHLTDEESPAGAVGLGWKGSVISGYSPVMPYTTQVFDAAVQTVNALHAQQPFDFGLMLGDGINNAEGVELDWYLATLDGGTVDPDTGLDDDPIAGPANDAQDPFTARGLDPAIPWYQVLGNHDHLWMGTGPIDDHVLRSYLGTAILNIGNPYVDPAGMRSRGLYMGVIDGSTPDFDVVGAGPVTDIPTQPQAPAADPARAPITSLRQWMQRFMGSTSQPAGHGYTQANLDSGSASYTVDLPGDVPLTLIVLDDTQPDDDRDAGGYGHPYLDLARFAWLVEQLDAGQAAGRLMLIAAHAPIGVEPSGSPMGWSPTAEVSYDELLATLHRYPNLVAWLSGHRHSSQITPFPSPDPTRPELGFWEVETSSLRDFPQLFRTFSLRARSDGTVALTTIDVDPSVAEGSLAAMSRGLSVAADQLFALPASSIPAGIDNAELVKPLSAEMQAAVRAVAPVE